MEMFKFFIIITVITSGDSQSTSEVRLVDGIRNYEGRVEVKVGGTWSTICGNWWDMYDARVVCRQLGFADAVEALRQPYFGNKQAFYYNPECEGTEYDITSCSYNGHGWQFCSMVASVVCTPFGQTFLVIEGKQKELPSASALHNVGLTVADIDSVNWFKGSGISKGGVSNLIVSLVHSHHDRFSIVQDATSGHYGYLIIESVNRTDAGSYFCQVVHKDGMTSWKSTIRLSVYYMNPPVIIKETTGNSVAIFSCEWSRINPDNTPSVTWFLDGRELDASKTNFELKKEYNTETLVIDSVSENDFGHYTCSIDITTSVGVMTKMSKNSVQLSIEPKSKGLTAVVIVTTVTGVIIGSVSTYQICRYIRRKKQERR